MLSLLREYISKGVFLGLWAYLALVLPDWGSVGCVLMVTTGGLLAGLLAGTIVQLARGYKPFRNPPAFALLVLTDSPFFIYLGVIGGLAAGVLLYVTPLAPETREAMLGLTGIVADDSLPPLFGQEWLYYCLGGGAVLGVGFFQMSRVKQRVWRLSLGVLIGAGLLFLAIFYLDQMSHLQEARVAQKLGCVILLVLPFFYVLTFCGEAEESEAEAAAFFALLGLGLYLFRLGSSLPQYGDKVILLGPALLYFVYALRVLPQLRVFKHTLRGHGYARIGRIKDSLTSFGRALTLDKKNRLAARGLFDLHRRIDVRTLDPEVLPHLNFDYCVRLAEGVLVGNAPPTPPQREEAMRMLDLVEKFRPPLRPKVDYLKGVTLTHAKDFDLAAGYLGQVLDPAHPYESQPVRAGVLFPAWDMALRLHPEIVRRLGESQLALPGRRVEAIRAVERKLAEVPDDPAAAELRARLYAGLTEGELSAASTDGPPADLNYDHLEQLGLALVDDPNPAQAERGMAFLRMAGRGLTARGPTIFTKLAEAAERNGQVDEAVAYLGQVKRAGLTVGPAALPPDQKAAYLHALKRLVVTAVDRGDIPTAIADLRTAIEAGGEDVQSLKQLADLHAKNGDVLNALLITERGLIYAKNDAALLAKKDSYYYSVDVQRVADARAKIEGWFDVEYCVRKARAVADQKEPDLDTLDYGLHLARLAKAVRPSSQSAIVAEARIQLRKGDRTAAISLLEDVREQPRGTGDDEDAWFLATRLLADLYLNELERPDLAVAAYTSYREYQKAGAETLFQLAKAHEATGNPAAAARCYDAVTAYKEHPRYWEASEASRRLKG